ncbi:conserved membrane hypothetical protein [Candidatus Sulfopaludibacter sp. SbA3]|nr:conserved membrane hypothetical protein [Candidatus Sulfopaludibacter sp. SbA3]
MQPNVRLAILAALALLLVACFSSPFQDDDAWWLLTTGQYIVHNHKLPVPDPFAFTTYIGKPEPTRNFQLTHQWLADAMLYLAYAAGGFPVVVWLRAVLMAAACGLAGLVARRRSGNFFAAVAAVLICAAIAYRFAGDQPAIVTFFGVAAAMAMAEDRRWRWAVPLLFLIWANCDDGFWLGWIALAFCCVEARRRQMWIVAALSVLACGINPNGFYWSALPLWPAAPLVALAAGYIRSLTVAARIRAARVSKRFLQWALAAAIMAVAALPVWQKRAFQFSAWEATRPLGAVKFLTAHHTGGLLFNTEEDGGYLMWHLWPRARVFADGRRLNRAVLQDYRRILYSRVTPGEKNVFQLLDQYGVQAIVTTAYDYPTGSPHFLIAMLADPNQTQWKLVYQDGQAMVFLRQAPPGVKALPNIAALSSMEAQCAAHIRLVPGEPLCARETCKIYEHLGNVLRARFWMAYYLEHKKAPDPAAETEYQRLIRNK